MKRRTLICLFVVVIGSACVRGAWRSTPTPPTSTSSNTPNAYFSGVSSTAPSSTIAMVQDEEDPSPPYDLAADLETRTDALRAELGAKTKFETVEDVFLIAAPNGSLGASAVVTKKALAAYFNDRFSKRPERAIAILLFDNAKSYDGYCKSHYGGGCSTPFGFYQPDDRAVIMNVAPGIGTLTHELVHPIVEADFPSAPTWINEGIASLYEAFSMPKPGEIRGNKNFRHKGLLAALRDPKERTHATPSTLFGMTDQEFRGPRESLHYATARYFCQWLDGQNKLWPFYHAWRDGFANDPNGDKSFYAVMGKTPDEIDAAWVAWVKAL